MISHPFPPLYNSDSKILILGSFPSVASRNVSFYYGHPRNRFWKVLSALFGEEEPKSNEEKKEMLLRHRLALWDVVASCEIVGSADASIRRVVPNDLSLVCDHADVQKIFLNGRTAETVFLRCQKEKTLLPYAVLPSTSPANAAYSLEKLIEKWSVILPHLS